MGIVVDYGDHPTCLTRYDRNQRHHRLSGNQRVNYAHGNNITLQKRKSIIVLESLVGQKITLWRMLEVRRPGLDPETTLRAWHSCRVRADLLAPGGVVSQYTRRLY